MARPLSLADLPDGVARFAEEQLASGLWKSMRYICDETGMCNDLPCP